MLAFVMHKILPTNSLKESCGDTFRLAYSSVHKILEKLRVPSLVDMYVEMRACEHGCDVLDWRTVLRNILLKQSIK